MDNKKLGRGLDALLGTQKQVPPHPRTPPEDVSREIPTPMPASDTPVVDIKVADVSANKYQPRTRFEEESLQSLKKSIMKDGFIQPILVRNAPAGGYELIAGERRLRCARDLGLPTIPAVIRKATNLDSLTLALIENLHRQDLNPIEKARGFHRLADEFNLTHDEIGDNFGMSRSSIANLIRILELPASVQELVSREIITYGHARALLGIPNEKEQLALCSRIVHEDLSVRQIEEVIRKRSRPASGRSLTRDPHIADLENRLRNHLGTKVLIEHKKKRGVIKIEYFSNDEFNRIFGLISGNGDL